MANTVPEQHDIEVSVVIAVKNEALHVEEAVRSVLEQTGLEFECIVVNDGSTDTTGDILAGLALQYPRLKVLVNPKKGKNSAFNYGMSHARGQFATLFAGDDIMPQGSLKARLDAVAPAGEEKYVVGLCKLETMSEDPKFNGHVVPKGKDRGGFTGVSYLMSRAVQAKIFPVPESLPNEDTWMELAVVGFTEWKQVHCGVIGCRWRVHAGNSINMHLPFPEYNRKYTLRMTAISMFYEQHKHELNSASQENLRRRIKCEEARARGSIIGVLFNRAPLIERLRALSTTNAFFYNLRRALFGLLSGF
ncbi:glycosyltransferase family 2 protein [Orrella dioscoreae]|uniref:glycosyltransferase family 2 protein n=1 Tax=Orrella dioscoreae TaxID=1851544 RepID=UPI0008356B29|nr:glycosyltransferase family 2 protein [Orrella dioscoreae]